MNSFEPEFDRYDPKLFQYLSQACLVFLVVLQKDPDIVEIHDFRLPFNWWKYVFHRLMECPGTFFKLNSIRKNESGHGGLWTPFSICRVCRFNLPIPRNSIRYWKDFGFFNLIHIFVHSWQGTWILHCRFVRHTIVGTESQGAFFQRRKDVRAASYCNSRFNDLFLEHFFYLLRSKPSRCWVLRDTGRCALDVYRWTSEWLDVSPSWNGLDDYPTRPRIRTATVGTRSPTPCSFQEMISSSESSLILVSDS